MEATALPRTAPLRLEASLAWALPVAITGALCVLYLVRALPPVDVAASTYRANLFADHGLTLWNGNWYGGHYTLSYSILSPPLTWLFGSGALAIAGAPPRTPPFHNVPPRHFGPRAVWGAAWFAV